MEGDKNEPEQAVVGTSYGRKWYKRSTVIRGTAVDPDQVSNWMSECNFSHLSSSADELQKTPLKLS